MKKTATMTINDKIITINEITVRQMMAVKDTFGTESIVDALLGLIPLLTDAPPEFLLDLAPSEIEEIWGKVKEVNASFLKVLPLDKMLAGYQETVMATIMSNLSALSARSLPQGME